MATRKKKGKSDLLAAGVSEPEIGRREVLVPDPSPEEVTPVESQPAKPALEPETETDTETGDSKTKAEAPKEKPRILPKVKLNVFLATCGKRVDQTAGFRRWMKGRKVRQQTIPEWHQMWETFQNRPVRGG